MRRRVPDDNVILITGAGGFVGRRMVERLRAEGRRVVGWTRAAGDLRDADAVQSAVADIRPALIFHLASQPPGPGAEDWSRVADEQRMLSNLAYAMRDHCTLVYTGSMAEYGRPGILRESDPCIPDTAYGCAKFAGTNLAVALRATSGLDIRAARLFGVYGPGEAPTRLLPSLIGKLRAGAIVPLSDGKQVRDFIHVDDVCAALVAFGAASPDTAPAVANIGTGKGVSVTDVCTMVADILDADPALLQFGAFPRRAVDQDCLIAYTETMRTFFAPPPQRWLDRAAAVRIVEAMIAAAVDHAEKSQ